DVRRKIDLVDHQEIGAGDAGAALRRYLVAGRDVDDVDGEVGELGREGGGEIVAARLDENQVEIGEAPAHVGDGREVDRGVLADGGVRAAAGLDAGDPLRRERARAHEVLGVPLGVDVVGDRRDVVARPQSFAQ